MKKRMPLILEPENAKKWLDNSLSETEIRPFFKPFKSEKLKAHTISRLISSRDKDNNIPDVQAFYQYPELIDNMESICDKFGDCVLAVLDEGKFWIEVFSAFMEWDEEGRQKWADEQMDSMKDHIEVLLEGITFVLP